jgi:UDP-glucose 4-epimerase
MRIIVTGASGFIGQKICYKLLEYGHDIVALCRSNKLVFSDLMGSFQHIPYEMGEVLPNEVINFLPQAIIHLAWNGIPDFSERKCLENLESQIRFFKQTENLKKLKKIIVAGTCLEYGSKQGLCFENERNQPDNYFSWAKQALSDYLKVLCQQQQIQLVWFRIFYIYGPGQRTESLIPTLVQAYNAKKCPELKNPAAANDYVHIEDVVRAFVIAIRSLNCQGTFNLGSGVTTSTARIANLVKQMVVDGEISLNQYPFKVESGETNLGLKADITHSASQLGWYPQISLEDGIRRTIEATRT